MRDLMLHDTYIQWDSFIVIYWLTVVVLVLGAAALIKYLFFR